MIARFSAPAADDLHPVLARAFASLDDNALPWCVLRRADELARPRGDVDVLIDARSLPEARGLLAGAGLFEVPSSAPGSHRFFVGYDADTDCWLELDVVTKLAFGRLFALETDAAEACLRARRRNGRVWSPSPPDAFWAFFLHCLLDKKSFPLDDRRRLEALASRVTADRGALLCSVLRSCPGVDADAVLAAVRRGDWGAATSCSGRLGEAWLRGHPAVVSRALVRNGARRVLEAWTIVRRRPGLMVAFLGIDGAGKTTLVAGLEESLPFPVRVVYAGMWQSRAGGPLPGLRRAIRPAVRPFGIWGRYARARWHRLLGRLVLFDRYTYDAHLPPEKPFLALKRVYLWLLARSSPPPDLVALLDVPAGEAAARKPDEAEPQHERHRLRLLELQARLPRLVVLDAARPAQAVRRDAAQVIWQRYRAGWRR